MKITIVGIKNTKFTNKETGELVEGQTVFFEHEDEYVNGLAVDKCFLSRNKMLVPIPHVPVGANLFYNKYGKVDEIIVIK